MPVKAIPFKPGVNREKSRYAAEGGWYDCNRVRFRQGWPEKIGGWVRSSENTFLGICRSLSHWTLLSGQIVRGVGTHLKFYIEQGGQYYDITPIRSTTSAGDVTFSASNGDATITVSDTGHGSLANDFVTFSGAATLGGLITADVLNQEYQIATVIDADSYTVEAKDTNGDTVTANASDTGNGGASVVGAYQVNTGPAIAVAETGWGASGWGLGAWGEGEANTYSFAIGLWTQDNFGEDLIFGQSGSSIYYWDATNEVTTRGVYLNTLGGASDVPTIHNHLLVANRSRIVIAFGCNEVGSSELDEMLIRWSDQEDAANWTPAATNQAGSIRLSNGSKIVAVEQARQEILVWTDTTLYSMQYVGAPEVFSIQTVGENITVINDRSVSYVSGHAYWIGAGMFYKYDGHVEPLRCDVRKYVFGDFNNAQNLQVFSGTVDRFHEVWWFYCSADSTVIDKYVVYNYRDDIWYYGTLGRTAWEDCGCDNGNPIAANYSNQVLIHEVGVDNFETGEAAAISAYVESAQFDIDDGDRYAFVRKLLPDVNFEGSTSTTPAVTISITPLKDSGAGANDPLSEGGVASDTSTRTVSSPLEIYTKQLNLRTRGRQMSVKVESSDEGVQWQLGKLRLDMRASGRRG